MEKQKILYLSYDGMTDPLGQSQVLPYLCDLSKYGYKFSLISFEKPKRFVKHAAMIQKIADENMIGWYPMRYTKKPPVLSTLKDIRSMKRQAILLQKNTGFDIVHCRGHIPALVGIALKKKFGTRLLFDNRGFWPDEKVDAGAWKLDNPLYNLIYRFFKRKEKQIIQNADHIVCLTHNGLSEMKQWGYQPKQPQTLSVIPCCADTELFDPSQTDPISQAELQLKAGIRKGDVIISYLGSIGTWYLLDEMLDFFKVFKKAVPAARFLFITYDEHDHIRVKAAEKNIAASDVLIFGAMRKEVPVLLSLSSYSVFFIRPSYSKISSSPTKQAEIMSMGIPAICNKGIGDTDTIITTYQSGVVVPKTTQADYSWAIGELLTTDFDSNAIRKAAIAHFSLHQGVEAYHQVYISFQNSIAGKPQVNNFKD
jgi:glycosyltransferase involved in cell wall biosynthesis